MKAEAPEIADRPERPAVPSRAQTMSRVFDDGHTMAGTQFEDGRHVTGAARVMNHHHGTGP
jgi:hypothetical protein